MLCLPTHAFFTGHGDSGVRHDVGTLHGTTSTHYAPGTLRQTNYRARRATLDAFRHEADASSGCCHGLATFRTDNLLATRHASRCPIHVLTRSHSGVSPSRRYRARTFLPFFFHPTRNTVSALFITAVDSSGNNLVVFVAYYDGHFIFWIPISSC